MPEKKPEFTVTDRRKFTMEGELREAEADSPQPSPPAPEAKAPAAPPEKPKADHGAPPAAEQAAAEKKRADAKASEEQNRQYRDSAKKLDDLLGQPGDREAAPMNFERLVQSIYMTAAVQLGAGAAPNEQPRVDIIGAQQSIDMLGVLEEKTRNNLNEKEQQLLQNALFDLRMSFLEITKAIAAAARKPSKTPPSH